MGLTSPSAPFKGERSGQAPGSGVRTPGAQSTRRGQCPVRRSHPAQWQIWKRYREDRWSPSRFQGCPETQRCLTLPSAWKATAQGPVRAGGSQTGRDPTQGHWAGRGPTQPPASGKALLASLGCKRRVASPQMVSDAGPSLTFARVSAMLTSGCFAGYLAMSHSKWVTKDVKSSGRT